MYCIQTFEGQWWTEAFEGGWRKGLPNWVCVGEKLSKDNEELKLSKEDGERVCQTERAWGKEFGFLIYQ